jgi:hypothetical protein
VFAIVDDIAVKIAKPHVTEHYQLKNVQQMTWGSGKCSLTEAFVQQQKLCKAVRVRSRLYLVVPHQALQSYLQHSAMRDAVLPKGKPASETYAYSLEEITQMLNVLPEPAATIVAVAAFTDVRKGELRGFLWENYDGEQVLISQSFWRACTGAKDPTEQSTGSSHRPTCSTAGLAPSRVWQSSERIGVPQPRGQAYQSGCASSSSGRTSRHQSWNPVAWLACFSPRTGDESSPSRSFRQDDPKNLAALERNSYTGLLYQDSRLRSHVSDAAIRAISRICT